MVHKVYTFENIKYIVSYPTDFCEEKTYPTIFFMHGSGNRGDDINLLFQNAYFLELKKHEDDFPFITVAPQCSADTWFELWHVLKGLVQHVATLPFVDTSRLYLMGTSMGGYGAWQLAMSIPEYFAAMVPICGGGMYWNAGRLINIPIWAFHGADDTIVLPEESQKMVNAVNNKGGNAKLTIYPDTPHSVWLKVYSDPQVFDWLLQYENQNTQILQNCNNDIAAFG